jgi:hypothetical protein
LVAAYSPLSIAHLIALVYLYLSRLCLFAIHLCAFSFFRLPRLITIVSSDASLLLDGYARCRPECINFSAAECVLESISYITRMLISLYRSRQLVLAFSCRYLCFPHYHFRSSYDRGDLAFIIIAGGMVFFMVPGLGARSSANTSPHALRAHLFASSAFLYSGLSRRKSARMSYLALVSHDHSDHDS